MAYSYPAMVAWNPGTSVVVKNTQFLVYATTDTSFTTPLAITDNQGNTLANLNSGSQGVFPSFQQAQYTIVVVSDTPAHTYAWTVTAALTNPVMQWAANTYFAANQIVADPNGVTVMCNVSHTSTSTYDATKFTPVQSGLSAALSMILGGF